MDFHSYSPSRSTSILCFIWSLFLLLNKKNYVIGAYDGSSGGAELIEKLNLMELAGIGLGSESYLTNSSKLYWLASIIRFSNFISIYQQVVPNGLDILKREFELDFVLQNRVSKDFARAIWSKMITPDGMDDIDKKIKKLFGKKYSQIFKPHIYS